MSLQKHPSQGIEDRTANLQPINPSATRRVRWSELSGSVQKHISTSAVQSVVSRGGLDRRRLVRVLDYIEANLEGDLSLDRMASIACLSRFHFARAFKQAVGHSPLRYVTARRLEHAKVLLMQDDRSLVDIALALDFSCQSNFTRAFTQATGLAPGRFRHESGLRQRYCLPAGLESPGRLTDMQVLAAIALPARESARHSSSWGPPVTSDTLRTMHVLR